MGNGGPDAGLVILLLIALVTAVCAAYTLPVGDRRPGGWVEERGTAENPYSSSASLGE
jgi:hypothetical protein